MACHPNTLECPDEEVMRPGLYIRAYIPVTPISAVCAAPEVLVKVHLVRNAALRLEECMAGRGECYTGKGGTVNGGPLRMRDSAMNVAISCSSRS